MSGKFQIEKFQIKGLLAVLALLAGCNSIPREYRPDPRPAAAWEQKLRALECDYRRHSLSIRSHAPLVFAIMAVCQNDQLAPERPGLGYVSLVVVDTGRNEVQSTRIKTNWEGGLHYTATGDLMWFSSATAGTPHKDQRFIEVFAASAGTVAQRSLGQLAIPFAAYPPYVHVGEGCHLLEISAFMEKPEDPRQQMMWVFRDEDPIASAKPVEGVGRILYWNPVGKYFVTQKQQNFYLGPQHSSALERSGLTCSGESFPLTGEEAERLAKVTYIQAKYLPLPNGDLVVASELEGSQAGELLVFRGDRMDRKGPFSIPDRDCPDFPCATLDFAVYLRGASATGRHFLAEIDSARIYTVYRVDDLAKVRRWWTSAPSDRYVYLFVDDSTVMQLETRGGPISYYEIPRSQ